MIRIIFTDQGFLIRLTGISFFIAWPLYLAGALPQHEKYLITSL
jgi:hypothetical protein